MAIFTYKEPIIANFIFYILQILILANLYNINKIQLVDMDRNLDNI